MISKEKLKLENRSGITLIALVITIIVLLILAGVSLSAVFSQDGIFHRAEQATDKYGQAKARETLELALGEAQMKKYEEGLIDEQLDEQIKKVGSLIPKEDENSKYQLVIVEGHIFEVDRSVPKIVNYKGAADGIIITASIKQNENWQNPVATVTGTITKYGGGTVISSSATATNGVTISDFPTAGGSYTISNITEDTDITITAQDSEGHEPVTEVIKVRLVRDNTPPTITSFEAKAEGLNIIISARAEDDISGMQSLTYNITSVEDTTLAGIPTDKRTGALEQGKPITIETTPTGSRDETIYKMTVTAKDNANNSTTSPEKEVKTMDGGVIKHIKLNDGALKEINTKDIYGSKITGYTCDRTDVEWQVFYIDEEDDHRVYLIAKDFMEPPTKVEEVAKEYDQPKGYQFTTTLLDKYKTIIPDNTFTRKFLKEYAGADASLQFNLQATNFMLNENVWAEYLNMEQADFAFGGPTLPLFEASYNDNCKIAQKLDYKKGEKGYQVKKGSNNWTNNIKGLKDINTQKLIYFKGIPYETAYGTWLASPSNARDNWVLRLVYDGELGYGYGGPGFRPIISLKSSVTFTDNGNGTYTIN